MKLKNIMLVIATVLLSVPALAQAPAEAAASSVGLASGLIAIASALCISIAAFGGAFAQGRAAAAALDGVARNPAASGKLTVPLVLSLALIESLVIYALIIAFQLNGSVGGAVELLRTVVGR